VKEEHQKLNQSNYHKSNLTIIDERINNLANIVQNIN
jgi:hypothetical protein